MSPVDSEGGTANLSVSLGGIVPVSSVFGRTGAVVAEDGDYSAYYDALGAANAALFRAQRKLVPIALRSNHLGNSFYLSPAGENSALYQTQHVLIVGTRATGLTLEYGNFSLYYGPSALMIQAAVTFNSLSYPVSFGGNLSGVIQQGMTLRSDPIPGLMVDQNEFEYLWVRTVVSPIQTTAITTGGELTAGTPITSLPDVTALSFAAPAGSPVVVTSGLYTQTFTLASAAIAGATSLTIESATPNYSFPVGSTVSLNGGQWPVGLTLVDDNGEGVTYDVISHGVTYAQQPPPSSPTTSGGDSAFSPTAILGYPENPTPSVGLVGDSIIVGTGDVGTDYGFADTTGDNGWAMRLLNRTVPYVWYAKYGDTAVNMAAGQDFRAAPLDHMTSMVDQLGINDVTAGTSISALVNGKLSLARQASVRGLPLYWTTLTPVTTSTDLWATTTNQTTNAHNSVRVAFNDWLRAGAAIQLSGGLWVYAATGTPGAVTIGDPLHPVWGYFDLADAVESGQDSGLWKPVAGRTGTDAAMSSSTNTNELNSASANFTNADISSQVLVAGASGGAATLIGEIQSINSATQAVLSVACYTTVSAARWVINPWTVDGTHPTAIGHAAMAAACTLGDLATVG